MAAERDRGRHAIVALGRDGSKPYLGDRAVVAGVLAEMVRNALGASDADDARGAVENAVHILTGQDRDYEPVGEWNRTGIGDWVRAHMEGVPPGDAAEAVRYALAHLVLHYLDAAAAVEAGAAPEELGPRLRSLSSNWADLMLGLPEALSMRS